MASTTLLFLAFFASTVSVILSLPQLQQLAVQPQQDADSAKPVAPAEPNVLIADNVPQYIPRNPRTFGSLFNLSAYLEGAPTNSAALNFIPLITILSALG